MIVDSAIYVDGRRAAEPASLEETYEAGRKQHGLAWIGLYEPTEEEFSSVAEEFGLHPLAVEDAIEAHQRPKIERYGEALFVVLKPAHYIDESETVEFGEIHVFAGRDFVLTLEDPYRFEKSRSVGAYLGLVPASDRSGDRDPQKRISKEGDEMLRKLLVHIQDRFRAMSYGNEHETSYLRTYAF
jgi:Mg2+ and Co2+ transporter CorA